MANFYQSEYPSIYRGVVELNKDPMNLGRCKIRVPAIHGPKTYSVDILPWARPITNTPISKGKGNVNIPDVGDIVWVMFEGANKEYPIYLGGTYGTGEIDIDPDRVILHIEDENVLMYDRKNKSYSIISADNSIEISEESITMRGKVDFSCDGKESLTMNGEPLIFSTSDSSGSGSSIKLANNLTTTEEGFALDASQGSILKGLIDNINLDAIYEELSRVSSRFNTSSQMLWEALGDKAEREHAHDQYLTEHQDLSNYAKKSEIQTVDSLSFDKDSLKIHSGDRVICETEIQRDCISVDEFGCIGDGSTDNTRTLQSAINHAQEKGVGLFIPTGTYCFSDRLFITEPLQIYGNSVDQTTLHFTGGRQSVNTSHFDTEWWEEGDSAICIQSNNVTISSLRLYGVVDYKNTEFNGICLHYTHLKSSEDDRDSYYSCDRVFFHSVKIQGFRNNLFIFGGWQRLFLNCEFWDATDSGVKYLPLEPENTGGWSCSGDMYIGCHFNNNHVSGLYAQGCYQTNIWNGVFEWNYRAVTVINCDDITFYNCWNEANEDKILAEGSVKFVGGYNISKDTIDHSNGYCTVEHNTGTLIFKGDVPIFRQNNGLITLGVNIGLELENVVSNSGFYTNAQGVQRVPSLEEWTVYPAWAFAVDTDVMYEGDYSVKFNVEGRSDNPGFCMEQSLSIDEGKYRVSCQIQSPDRSSIDAGFNLGFVYYDSNNGVIGYNNYQYVLTGNNAWETAETTFDVPSGTSRVVVKYGPVNNGTGYFAVPTVAKADIEGASNVQVRVNSDGDIECSNINGDILGTLVTDSDISDLQAEISANTSHSTSAHAPSTAEKNAIIGIQKNGADVAVNSSTRKVNITVPTKVSELTNDSGFKTTDTNTTYKLVKSGSAITLTGSDGSTTSVADIEGYGLLKDTIGHTSKNLLRNTATSQTVEGITFTVNEDGSVTADGTSTEAAVLILGSSDTELNLETGRYILSGCPRGSGNTYRIQFWNYKGDDIASADFGDGLEIDFTNEDGTYNIAIGIPSGVTVSNLTFYPMLRKAEIMDDTYEQYHESVDYMLDEIRANLDYLPHLLMSYTDNHSTMSKDSVYSSIGYVHTNLLKNTAETQTVDGLTVTINDDGSITLDGDYTGTGTSIRLMDEDDCIEVLTSYIGSTFVITLGDVQTHTYVSDYINITARSLQYQNSMSQVLSSGSLENSIIKLADFSDSDTKPYIYLYISSGATFDNLTIKPMLKLITTDSSFDMNEDYSILFSKHMGYLMKASEAYTPWEPYHETIDTRLKSLEEGTNDSGLKSVEITLADYEALGDQVNNDNIIYYIKDDDESDSSSSSSSSSGGDNSTVRYVSDETDEDYDWIQVQDAKGNWINTYRAYTQRYELYVDQNNGGEFEAYKGTITYTSTTSLGVPAVTFADTLRIEQPVIANGQGFGCVISKLIDLSRFKTIKFHHVSNTVGSTIAFVNFFIVQSKGTIMSAVASQQLSKSSSDDTDVEIDISAFNGEYYLGIELNSYSSTRSACEISNFYME